MKASMWIIPRVSNKYTHAMPVYKFSRYKADTIMILSHVSVL